MQKAILSDASCLILLEKIGELGLLHKLFGTIFITKEVELEFGRTLPEWILTKSPLIDGYQRTLEKFLDPGEASMLALAKEMEKPLLIMDDLKARRYAKENGFALTGTLGVLMEAKKKGHILKLQEILQKMQATNFRISPNLISEALKMVGEET